MRLDSPVRKSVTLRDVVITPRSNAVFVGEPHDLEATRVTFNAIGGDALFASTPAAGAVITIRDSVFNQSSVAVAADAVVTLEHNSLPGNNGSTSFSLNSPGLDAELRGNHFAGAPCQAVVNIDAGTFVFRENLFEQMSTFGCRAIQIGEDATITLARSGTDAPNRFVGNIVDLDVRTTTTVDARGVEWSAADPCDVINLVAGASVDTDAGTCNTP